MVNMPEWTVWAVLPFSGGAVKIKERMHKCRNVSCLALK